MMIISLTANVWELCGIVETVNVLVNALLLEILIIPHLTVFYQSCMANASLHLLKIVVATICFRKFYHLVSNCMHKEIALSHNIH